MAYLKPQSPLQHKDGDYFYPLTTIDQVILDDGISRLSSVGFIKVDTEEVPEGEISGINADTLGGYPASDYVRNVDGENVVTMSNITIELTMDNWIDKKQLVNIDKVTAENTIIVSASPSNHKEYCQSGVYCSAQDDGVLTFTCDTIPEISLFVNIVILH